MQVERSPKLAMRRSQRAALCCTARPASFSGAPGQRSPARAEVRKGVARCSLAAAFGLLLASCSHFERVGQCRQLAHALNPALARVAELHTRDGSKPDVWAGVQAAYEALRGELVDLSVADESLIAFRTEYVRIVSDAADAAGKMAGALQADHDKDLRGAQLRLRALASEQSRLNRRIERHCRP